MFNYEHLPIHRQLHTLPFQSTVGEIVEHLYKGVAVCIPVENNAYLFTNEDLWLFKPLEHEAAIHFLKDRTNLLSILLPTPDATVDACELFMQLPSATQRPIVFKEKDGAVVGYCLIADIITFLCKEQQKFSSYFYTLADTVTDAVTVVDSSGTVICWNSIAEETYGILKKDILGRRIGEHFDPQALMVLKMLDEGRMIRNTYHQPRSGNHVLVNASPIIDSNGDIIGGIATEQDITQLVRLNDELYSSHRSRLDDQSTHDDPFCYIKGTSRLIGNVIRLAKKVAGTENPLLLFGEAGVGKEQLAQVIHQASPRTAHPFITINCGSIPGGLLESELFGFQGGAFSGNDTGSAGKLEMADQGTLFLNEIDRLPMDCQTKLLQYIQQQIIVRTGGTLPIPLRTRIIAATEQDLQMMVDMQLFRSDLYYALSIISIALPTLRERKEDIHALVQTFVRQFALKYQKPIPQLDPEVMLAFSNYDWPGNINELMSVVERCLILSENEQISLSHLPLHLQKKQPQLDKPVIKQPQPENQLNMLKLLSSEEEERSLIETTLAKTLGNKSATAKLLGISRGTLYNKMKEFQLL
ncbi:sigma-54-dependent Fis family transcriptional regulator [Paenibacillus sp. N3.4]|uniref:sigma-54 interaction domain-containing protein n=1 Tax=Paenibacillus sp. N3.4 TaxID=2603222 RepID=UPI0011CAF0E9|nr:sigma 54-interacting transcriptional regulator [Paenibacillus sp. N3.4]TXK84175.1 PAS domain S-box protein [Paenibacillus sp. N3.4]